LAISERFTYKKSLVVVGDSSFSLNVDNAGLSTENRGIAVYYGAFSGFIGATSNPFDLPYLKLSKPKNFGAGLSYFTGVNAWKFKGIAVINGNLKSVAESVSFNGAKLHFSETAGLSANRLLLSGNVTYKPKANSFLFGLHQDFYYKGNPGILSSCGTSTNVRNVNLSFFASNSHYLSNYITSISGGARVKIKDLTFGEYVAKSQGKTFSLASAEEKVNNHLNVSGGLQNKSPSFGLNYVSNKISVSLSDSLSLTPLGYQKSQNVTIAFYIPKTGVLLHLGFLKQTSQSLRYTAYGTDYVTGPIKTTARVNGRRQVSNTGKYTISGSVKDSRGKPVDGAALLVGKAYAFTNEEGTFFIHVKKNRPYLLSVKTDEFTCPGNWSVVTAPKEVQPATEVLIVVTTK